MVPSGMPACIAYTANLSGPVHKSTHVLFGLRGLSMNSCLFVHFLKHLRHVTPGETPLEGLCDGLVVGLEPVQTARQFFEGAEIVRCQHFPLNYREVDLDLIEPTRMDGPVNEDQSGVFAPKPLDCSFAAVGGAV